MLALYRGLSTLSGPLIGAYLARRMARGKEDAARFDERLGRPGRERPPGPLVWAHGASVGESLSILPVIGRLIAERPALHVLVTTGTVTSAALMAARLPPRAVHQYVPVDRIAFVRRFLDHWRPDMALWIESEFWPNLLSETERRGTPVVLLNARMSRRSFARWRRFKPLIRPLLSGLALALAQSEDAAARLTTLGAKRAEAIGNLKFAAPPLPADAAELARMNTALGARPRWLAASTHAGEEDIAAAVHRRLAARHAGLITLIAPRHPARGPAIAEALSAAGLRVARRSHGELPDSATDVYLADTMGELGLFYRLGRVAFVGGSLVRHGGHNPVEPARLGCAVLFGPFMTNFRDIAGEMLGADAAIEASDADCLAAAVDGLLAHPLRAEAQGTAARTLAEAKSGVLDAVMDRLGPFLDPLATKETPRARA